MDKHIDNKKNDTITIDECIAFPDEISYYESIKKKLETSISDAIASVDNADKEYLNLKFYMSDYRGELDPHEMFQNSMAL